MFSVISTVINDFADEFQLLSSISVGHHGDGRRGRGV